MRCGDFVRGARSGSCVFAHSLTRNEPSTVRSITCTPLHRVTTKCCSCTATLRRRPIFLVEQRVMSKVQPRRSLMQRFAERRLCVCGRMSSAHTSSTCTTTQSTVHSRRTQSICDHRLVRQSAMQWTHPAGAASVCTTRGAQKKGR